MKDTLPPRICCYSADLVLITGKSLRSCQRLMQQIRFVMGLQKHQYVTIYHVSDYLDLELSQILPYVKG